MGPLNLTTEPLPRLLKIQSTSVIAPVVAARPDSQTEVVEHDKRPPLDGTALKRDLYPEHLLPVAGAVHGDAGEFDLLREQLLVGYGYNTARAYWGDLEHWRDWCESQDPVVDPLRATSTPIRTYFACLSELEYSPNTQARRVTSLRALFAAAETGGMRQSQPIVLSISRRKSRK